MNISIGLPGILTIIFIFLKVFNMIDWSWWWIFSPLWISALAGVGILIIVSIFIIIGALIST